MKQYLDLLNKILKEGTWKENRTGIPTLSVTGFMFEHNMSEGFPACTTKKLAMKSCAVELEGFIKGIGDKKWYEDRNCKIWSSWCNPKRVPYGNDPETKAKMAAESDLGRIYGVQWRSWRKFSLDQYGNAVFHGEVDQLKRSIEILKKDPFSRRVLINAWNVSELDEMALVPCHFNIEFLSDGKYLDLIWSQRSCDIPVGIPFNIASYGLLLELVAKEVGLIPNKLIGMLADCHIYKDQMDGVLEQIQREPHKLPTLSLGNYNSIFDWDHTQFKLENYTSHPKISYPVAV